MADNKHRGPTLDSFLEEEGVLAEFQAKAIKEVIAWQLAEAMKERKLSKNRLATMMHTSRTQVENFSISGLRTLTTALPAARYSRSFSGLALATWRLSR